MKTKMDYYRIFYETARHASFSTAAEHLYVSQSAISQCIRQLEQDLNTQLFLRSRRGVTLTKEGVALFQKVENAIQSIEQGETLLTRLQHLDSGTLIIAASDTITSHYLLPFLETFHKEFPGVHIEMANSYSSQMLHLVKEGKAELAFINLPAYDDELCIEPCLNVHDIFVSGKNYTKKEKYTRSEIAEEPLVLLEKNSSSRMYVEKEFKKDNISLKPHIEVAAHDLLLRFASIHLGVACVVEEFSYESLANGSVTALTVLPPLPSRSIGYAYLKHMPLSPAARTFLDMIQNSNNIK